MTAPHSDPRVFWRCSPGRRLPAHARDLADARARDLVPAQRQVVVYLDRWPAGPVTGLGPAICCPPDFHPGRLDWRYLAALSVLVVTPGSRVVNTFQPSSRKKSARSGRWLVFPLPSGPSRVMNMGCCAFSKSGG